MARNLAAAPTKQTPGENSGKVVLPEKSTLYSPKDAILTPKIGFLSRRSSTLSWLRMENHVQFPMLSGARMSPIITYAELNLRAAV